MAKRKMSANPKKGPRRQYSAEYKAEVVKLCALPGKTPYGVANELGLPRSPVALWVQQASLDAAGGREGQLTTAERNELSALRRENRQLRQEREILKRATAFFVREGTS